MDFVLKTNPRTYKIKDLNGEKIIKSFYEKNYGSVNDQWVNIQNQIAILEMTSKKPYNSQILLLKKN